MDLENKINENFREMKEKNRRTWSYKYREKTEKFSEVIRDGIFREEFDDFNEFVKKFETLKMEYDNETAEGD